ncbi:MAG: hypothetical protein KAK02_09000, partial [Desulfobulbaceae bacterium]|nr:hypothetical protein [Desulfobulbaceae bacterium]
MLLNSYNKYYNGPGKGVKNNFHPARSLDFDSEKYAAVFVECPQRNFYSKMEQKMLSATQKTVSLFLLIEEKMK